MSKLAIGALISLLALALPASNAAAQQSGADGVVKKHHSRTAKVKAKQGGLRMTLTLHEKLVRRVMVVHGRRRVVYQHIPLNMADAAVPSAGDLAGLNLTRDPLELKSSVALVLDEGNSEVLFEKNAGVALPIASITKLMTGMVVVEAGQDMNEVLEVTDEDVDRVKHSSSRLKVGSRLTRSNMLHIALMSSENRAASALGRNYPGGLPAFVEAMNAKAQSLGMTETHYVDSNGLSSANVASARDLARLAIAANQEPILKAYSTDRKYVVDASGRPMQFANTNGLVATPGWKIGLQKTGYITEAGRCLVMQAMIQGRAVIMVFLDSKGKQSRTADAGRMRKWLEAVSVKAPEVY